MTSIGNEVFENCDSLERIDVDKNNIGDYSWLRTYLEKATTNPDQLSRDILDKAKELSNGKVMDDMTVVVSKLYSLY